MKKILLILILSLPALVFFAQDVAAYFCVCSSGAPGCETNSQCVYNVYPALCTASCESGDYCYYSLEACLYVEPFGPACAYYNNKQSTSEKPNCIQQGCATPGTCYDLDSNGTYESCCGADEECRYYNGRAVCTDSGWECNWDWEVCPSDFCSEVYECRRYDNVCELGVCQERDASCDPVCPYVVDNSCDSLCDPWWDPSPPGGTCYYNKCCYGGDCAWWDSCDMGACCDCTGSGCSGNDADCGSCQYCSSSDCSCYDYCPGTDTDCGCTTCTNCNASDGCSGGYYLDYYCLGTSCTYTSTCTEACCDAYYGDTAAYCSEGVCYPPPTGCDNDGICETGQGETYSNCPNDCCASDCTATYDSTCHSTCNGWNGCFFTSGCDGVSSGNTVCSGNQTATCCEGSFTCVQGFCGAECDSNDDCPGGATCLANCICSITPCECFDGTPCNQCVVGNPPQYCNSTGNLVNNCNICGCPTGQVCQPDGSCAVSQCTEGGSCLNPGEICCAEGILYECQEVIAFGPSEEVYTYKESPNEEYENQLLPVSKIASLGAASIVNIVKEFWQKILRFSF